MEPATVCAWRPGTSVVGWGWASQAHDVTVLNDTGGVPDRWVFPHTEAGWVMTLGVCAATVSPAICRDHREDRRPGRGPGTRGGPSRGAGAPTALCGAAALGRLGREVRRLRPKIR